MDSHLLPFLKALKDQGLADGSLRAYQSELLRLKTLLAARAQTWETISAPELLHLVAAGGRAPGTRRRAQHIVGRFLAFTDHPATAAFKAMPLPRVSTPAPDSLAESEEKALRKALKARTDRTHQPRDRALICLLLDTGLRVGEAVALSVGDVDLADRRIRLVGKGGKKRSRFLPQETRDLLKGLVGTRLPEAPLFTSKDGGALSDRHIRRLLSTWAHLAGITRPLHPHLLRHTFATSLLRKTGNLRLVQLALDHESPKTTAIYAHVADEELRSAIESRWG